MKLAPYETENFPEEVANAWEKLKPMYEELHAYVRNKLTKRYTNASYI